MANKLVFADEPITHTAPVTIAANLLHTTGFYGAAPVASRSSSGSFHSTSWVSASSNITVASALAAWATEVTATLVALGIWN